MHKRFWPCVGLALTTIVLVAAGLFATHAVAQQIDLGKLKPGDMVEVAVAGKWVPAKFLEKLSNRMARVQRDDIAVATAATTDTMRMVASNAAADDDPFATPEEKIAKAAKQRIWSDRSGRFRLEATLLRVSDDKAILRRDDGKEISVPLVRLSDSDKEYLSGLTATTAPAKSGNVAGNAAYDTADLPRIPVMPSDLAMAPQVDIRPDVGWSYTPVAHSPGETMRPTQISLEPIDILTHAKRMLFLPSETRIFVVLEETQFGGKDTLFHVQSCDVERRKVDSSGVFGSGVAPLAVSPDGAFVVARTERSGSGGRAELQLYSRQGNQVKSLTAWLPYRHYEHALPKFVRPKATADDPDRPSLGPKADVAWADFIDSQHLMTMGVNGELGVWSMPEIKPVYYMPPGNIMPGQMLQPAMSPGNVYCAVPTENGVALLRSKDGVQVGFLPTDMDELQFYRLAWSGDGTRLALFQPGRVRTWNLTTQEMTRDFPVSSGLIMQNCGWVDNTHVVVNGRILVDVERRIPVAVISGVFDSDAQLLDGVLWTLSGLGPGPATIKGKAALPKNFKDPARGQTAEQLLLIRPGDEVAVDLQPSDSPDGSDLHTAVIRKLEKNGMRIVPDSKIRLVGTLKMDNSGRILALNFTIDGETAWTHTTRIGLPEHIQIKNGESVGQAISSEQNVDANELVHIWIPALVVRVPAEVQAALAGRYDGH